MMIFALFLSCLVAGSFACSDDHCRDPILADELKRVMLMPNEEQLRTLCPKVLAFVECKKDALECNGQTLEELAASDEPIAREALFLSGATSLVREVCDESSSFHRDYVANIECFKGYLDGGYRLCQRDIMAQIRSFFNDLYDDGTENHSEIRCLTDAYELGCIVDKLGDSCGAYAQRTAIAGLQKMRGLLKDGACKGVTNAANLKVKLLDFLDLNGTRRNTMQSVFDLMKRRR